MSKGFFYCFWVYIKIIRIVNYLHGRRKIIINTKKKDSRVY